MTSGSARAAAVLTVLVHLVFAVLAAGVLAVPPAHALEPPPARQQGLAVCSRDGGPDDAPHVVDLPLAQAEQQLREWARGYGFNLALVPSSPPAEPAELVVVGQSEAWLVDEFSCWVRLEVGVRMPTLFDLSLERVQAELERLGLSQVDWQPAGVGGPVIQQEPAPGTPVRFDQRVVVQLEVPSPQPVPSDPAGRSVPPTAGPGTSPTPPVSGPPTGGPSPRVTSPRRESPLGPSTPGTSPSPSPPASPTSVPDLEARPISDTEPSWPPYLLALLLVPLLGTAAYGTSAARGRAWARAHVRVRTQAEVPRADVDERDGAAGQRWRVETSRAELDQITEEGPDR